jgi:Uncharacterised nucleotidyltransferase
MQSKPEEPAAAVRRLLTGLLRSPDEAASLPLLDLDLALRVARRVRLLGRVAERLQRSGALAKLPPPAREQLESALVVVDARARLARWELGCIVRALRGARQLKIVALKGSAYLLAGLPNAVGRVFADVDLLFDEGELAEVERLLLARGWRGTKLSPYDQHYYRAWAHELPPLVHAEREVEADLHHNIVPRTGRLKPPAARLLSNAQRIPGTPFHRLADTDLVLHAMTHLMFDSDMTDALRDLVDIDELLQHFAVSRPSFWDELWERAEELDLARPAFYALRYAHALVGTPVPAPVQRRSLRGAPPAPVVWLMDRLVPRALFPLHPDAPSRVSGIARFWLYVRSLWIRMPPLLLARHLAYKFYLRWLSLARRNQGAAPRLRRA